MDYKLYEKLKKELINLTPEEYDEKIKDIVRYLEEKEEIEDLLKEFK